MTTIQAKAKLVAWFIAQLNYHEGVNNWNKYASNPDLAKMYGWVPQNQPWCDTFVDTGFIETFGLSAACKMTYQQLGKGSALCKTSAAYYKNNNAWFSTPEVGDQVFFYVSGDINHTGLVVDVSGTQLTTVEGNSSDMVARRYYTIGDSRIAGFGRPDFSVVADPESASQSPAAASNSNAARILRLGCSGDDVKSLQKNLIALGYDLGEWKDDGDFGHDTLAAVVKFQRDHDLDDDGEVGNLTRAAIESAIQKNKTGQSARAGSTPSGLTETFSVGDIVMFSGNMHYISANSDRGYGCTKGKAKVTSVRSGAKHPYHVIKIAGGGSTVYGWVNAADLKKV